VGEVLLGGVGATRREASRERRYRCRRRLAVADGTRLTTEYLQEQRGRARIVRGGGANSTRASQNTGFTSSVNPYSGSVAPQSFLLRDLEYLRVYRSVLYYYLEYKPENCQI